ncbi:MAG: cation diffusion facilitator family transporter [Pseudorhodoferax sp.]
MPSLLPIGPAGLLKLSALGAVATIALKSAAWALTGSIGLLSDAMESFVNLAGALFALWMVQVARRPADTGHNYGHHKAEYFSSGFEGLLVLGAAVGIVWASAHRLLLPQPLGPLDLGLALSVASAVLNAALAGALFRGARAARSVALEGDARHLMTDVWTSAGVVAGLLAALATGWHWLDPLIGLAVALNIAREGARLVWRSSQGLMDAALEPALAAQIDAVLRGFVQREAAAGIRIDHVATRGAGHRRYAELHLHVPGGWSLARAARLRDEIEAALMHAVPDLYTTIQLLPLGMETRAVHAPSP